jgi:hypothetical protein
MGLAANPYGPHVAGRLATKETSMAKNTHGKSRNPKSGNPQASDKQTSMPQQSPGMERGSLASQQRSPGKQPPKGGSR